MRILYKSIHYIKNLYMLKYIAFLKLNSTKRLEFDDENFDIINHYVVANLLNTADSDKVFCLLLICSRRFFSEFEKPMLVA